MIEDLRKFIKKNMIKEKKSHRFFKFKALFTVQEELDFNSDHTFYKENPNLEEFINEKDKYNSFQTLLFKMIDERNLKDSDVYNKVHIDRRLFSKIRNKDYHPSKETIILLGLSLKLNEKEIIELLNSASYTLPKNNYYDLIIRFCFINKIYELSKVNELLDEYNCKLFNY